MKICKCLTCKARSSEENVQAMAMFYKRNKLEEQFVFGIVDVTSCQPIKYNRSERCFTHAKHYKDYTYNFLNI